MWKKKEIQEMNDSELISAFHWNVVRVTNETNSMRGVTQKSLKEEKYILDEMIKRFNLDVAVLKEKQVING
ncbi:hypothetical protein TROLL_260 [Bacillus phage Troll]|uniref:Uncharacterized protein n=1 Tax=Bacillus phage Troll TaxID=1382932 RepID=S5YQ47_9CAUD|nr:hypothetical protein TROLL_260 [Bacillus phage Troll]YP_009290138.1 hypothetical protein BI003_gp259 [Bacillus phage Phrodo]UGO49070.1 hypothetical protein JARJAR_256 [Bacillus phage vB_BanH_JarJar]UGO50560.1 hypothetical protein RONSWANSON_254 [Bacillus phage vB_BanH_RonSwanson]AGT13608.1 hypothetical protein TROLL_260 [Bacillus phage Troll]AMW62299.1 hypothetical protein PHRODO_259 [Bacillus phage Phrodo]